MGTTVPIDLIRLRSATATYLAILRDSVPALEVLVQAATTRQPEGAEPMAELHQNVQAALDVDDAPGTPAAILTLLAQLLGER